MARMTGYMAGANLGHWISQYGSQGKEHWDTYITEPDFARMAKWGLDHVRLPVDYMLFEDDEKPGEYREEGLAYVDATLANCKKYGLNLVLDLHHAPGFMFGRGKENRLFNDEKCQERFIAIWEMFARRYRAEGDNLIFELLNELVWETSDPWNDLWQRTVAHIRRIDPERKIIIGGNWYNGVDQMKHLVVSPDPNVLYNFHFYYPFPFTHQKAPWTGEKDFAPAVPYPVPKEVLTLRYGNEIPSDMRREVLDRDALAAVMQPAFDFIEKTGKSVYCGEYGVIGFADRESAARWLSDVSDLLLSHGIGRAVWSYRGFAAITANDNKSFDEKLVTEISKH